MCAARSVSPCTCARASRTSNRTSSSTAVEQASRAASVPGSCQLFAQLNSWCTLCSSAFQREDESGEAGGGRGGRHDG
eukprot:1801485-Rhodomonas_salina.1